jgi:hypothetical protein
LVTRESASESIPFSVRIAGDGEKKIATVGPFRVFARCDANNGATTDELGELVMTTTDANSAFDDNNGPENNPSSRLHCHPRPRGQNRSRSCCSAPPRAARGAVPKRPDRLFPSDEWETIGSRQGKVSPAPGLAYNDLEVHGVPTTQRTAAAKAA